MTAPRDPLSLPAILDALGRTDEPGESDPILALRRLAALLGISSPAEPDAAEPGPADG